MGMFPSPDECFITNSPTENIASSIDRIDYRTEYDDQVLLFRFPSTHSNSEKVKKNIHIIRGLIINKKFPNRNDYFYDNVSLEKIIDEAVIPSTPKEKLDALLFSLNEIQEYEGHPINIFEDIEQDIFLNQLYFKNYDEYWFYLNTLYSFGFITFMDTSSNDGNSCKDIRITFSGLEYIINLQEEGSQSRNCFIAMWFAESQVETRDAIKQVVTQCGYIPQLVDELHYESDITINDAIIQHIKRSKFLIADFTGQRAGVYFESGYALGKGKPVIYMCSAEDFKNRHFDTDHFPHIRYESLEDLKQMLEDKIKAWID